MSSCLGRVLAKLRPTRINFHGRPCPTVITAMYWPHNPSFTLHQMQPLPFQFAERMAIIGTLLLAFSFTVWLGGVDGEALFILFATGLLWISFLLYLHAVPLGVVSGPPGEAFG